MRYMFRSIFLLIFLIARAVAHVKNTHGYTEPIKQRTVHLQLSKDRDKTAQVYVYKSIVILVKKIYNYNNG